MFSLYFVMILLDLSITHIIVMLILYTRPVTVNPAWCGKMFVCPNAEICPKCPYDMS